MKNENYSDARQALQKAAEAAEKISDPRVQAETLTQIGHGFIRLGTEPFNPQPRGSDDTGAGFQPYESSR